MRNDNVYGPGNITTALGISVKQDSENLLDGSVSLSPRIHPVERAIAKQRKNSKPRDKHLWRFTLVL
jgi:3-methyladenine DNA glycosylase Mpg